jgi:hypothetical protein
MSSTRRQCIQLIDKYNEAVSISGILNFQQFQITNFKVDGNNRNPDFWNYEKFKHNSNISKDLDLTIRDITLNELFKEAMLIFDWCNRYDEYKLFHNSEIDLLKSYIENNYNYFNTSIQNTLKQLQDKNLSLSKHNRFLLLGKMNIFHGCMLQHKRDLYHVSQTQTIIS